MAPVNLRNDTANASPSETDIKQQPDFEKSVNLPANLPTFTSGSLPFPDNGFVAWFQVVGVRPHPGT
jgi:hypothetical protein